MNKSNFDWERFWIHFIFGAVLGAGIGLAFWIQHWYFGLSAWLLICGFSLSTALLSGIYGDQFWEWFLRHSSWLRWW